MSWIVISAAIAAIVVLILVTIGRIGTAQETVVSVSSIPEVYSKLERTGADGSFAVFIPTPQQSRSDEALNIQFSIENGVVGLDWVLISSVNIRDRDGFEDLARSKRIQLREVKSNNVRYLRTEVRDAPSLCMDVLKTLYGLAESDTVGLLVENFEWSANPV